MEEVEQDIVKKIVPVVVSIIKNTVVKRIFESPKLKSCGDI